MDTVRNTGPWPREHGEREDGAVSPDRDFDTDEERDALINEEWTRDWRR